MRVDDLQRVLLCFVVLCALVIPQRSEAQVLYGSVVGNVKDASDAAVVGATVVVTNTEIKQSRETTTTIIGGYRLVTLPPGSYDLKVSKEGFTTFTRAAIPVTVNNVSRIDVTINVGAVSESVTVTGAAPALQTAYRPKNSIRLRSCRLRCPLRVLHRRREPMSRTDGCPFGRVIACSRSRTRRTSPMQV